MPDATPSTDDIEALTEQARTTLAEFLDEEIHLGGDADSMASTVLAAGYLSSDQVAARIRAAQAEALRRAKADVTAHGDAYLRDAVGGDSTVTVGQLLDSLANLVEARS